MAVENISVNLGNSSHYDIVTSQVRGKTVPENGQTFSVTLDEITTNFEIENVSETVRSTAESLYSVRGREQRGEFLNRRVYTTHGMYYVSSDNGYILPSARSIVGALGLNLVWDADDFTPSVGGMGWAAESEKLNGWWDVSVTINEKSVQSLLEKLFSWSSEFGALEYKWHVRAGTLYIWQVKNATGQRLTITPDMCVRDSLKIEKSRLLKCSEVATTSSTTVETPKSFITMNAIYGDVPFTGYFSDGYAEMSYADGYLAQVISTYTNSDGNNVTRTETYGYGSFYGGTCLHSKVTNDDKKEITTVYDYTWEIEGRSKRQVPVLCYEETTSMSKNKNGNWTNDSESTEVHYSSLGNGFYGCTAVRKIDGDVDQVQHSVSRGSPGGAASQYTERQIIGYKVSLPQTQDTFPGYALAPTRLPIQDSGQAENFLTMFKNLHGSIESTITAELVGQTAFNPMKGILIYNGVEYYAVDSTVRWSKDEKRMSVSGVRWDFDPNYRKNVLGYSE